MTGRGRFALCLPALRVFPAQAGRWLIVMCLFRVGAPRRDSPPDSPGVEGGGVFSVGGCGFVVRGERRNPNDCSSLRTPRACRVPWYPFHTIHFSV